MSGFARPVRIMGAAILVGLVGGCGASDASRASLGSALARAAAEEAEALLGGEGTAVLIQIPDAPFQAEDEAAIDAELERELARRGIRMVAVEEISFDPRTETTGEPFDVDTLVDVVSRHADADLFISRVGLPRLTPDSLQRLPNPRPRLMIVTNYQVPYLHRLPRGIPDVAILPRRPGADAGTSPSEDGLRFEQLYEIVRTDGSTPSRPQP